MGKIDFGGVTREACLAYVPEAKIGDYTVIHVGFALHIISEEEANETLDLLRQLAEAGYIEVNKQFIQRKPHTMLRLSPKGRQALQDYRQTMKQALDKLKDTSS